MAVRIRPATDGDDGALAAFFAAYHEEFRGPLGDQDVTAEGLQARTYYARGALLVAVDQEEVLGCVAYEPWGDGRARMKRMYVPKEHRGRGIGRALAAAIVERARVDGNRLMVLDTTREMGSATRLYESMGFVPFEPDYVAPCVGTVYLSKTL